MLTTALNFDSTSTFSSLDADMFEAYGSLTGTLREKENKVTIMTTNLTIVTRYKSLYL